MPPKHDAGTATRHYRAFWQRRCRAAAAGAVLKPQGGNCAVLPLLAAAHPFSLAYSSSVTGSHHSLLQSLLGTSTAMWLNQLSALAPCQCLTLAGMVITVPGVRLTAGLPSSWYQPSPAALGYYVTAIFFQNPLSKKTARTTAYHTVYGQLIYGNTA